MSTTSIATLVAAAGRAPDRCTASAGRISGATVHTEEQHMPQGTIKDFDLTSGNGTLVDDDGTELSFATQAFLDSGLEELRLGQRVRFRRDGDGVADLQLVSL